MRFFKTFLFGLIGLFLVITLFSLLIPSTVKVARMVVISDTSQKGIYSQIADLQNWKNWQNLFMNDSVKIISSSNNANANQLAVIKFNGKEAKIQVTSIDTATVNFTLNIPGENESKNSIQIQTLSLHNSYQVSWTAITKMKWYPWEKFYAIFIDKITGPGYESSLNKLKECVEKGNIRPAK